MGGIRTQVFKPTRLKGIMLLAVIRLHFLHLLEPRCPVCGRAFWAEWLQHPIQPLEANGITDFLIAPSDPRKQIAGSLAAITFADVGSVQKVKEMRSFSP